MFQIDFLKGQGLPVKRQKIETGLFVGIAAAFVLIMGMLLVQYFYKSAVLGAKQRYLTSLEARLQKTAGEGSVKSRIKKNLGIYNECYFEIADSLNRYVQWTPLLQEIANSMPSSMLLNELGVNRTVKKEKVASVKEPGKQFDYEIIGRTLNSNLYTFNPDANGTAVKKYLAVLRESNVLNKAFEKVYLAESSDAEYRDYGGKINNVKNYIIRAQFKSQKAAGKN